MNQEMLHQPFLYSLIEKKVHFKDVLVPFVRVGVGRTSENINRVVFSSFLSTSIAQSFLLEFTVGNHPLWKDWRISPANPDHWFEGRLCDIS